ncbi:MAG: hypothetical protein IID40_07815 [Planctomycetes bacterium]|nr:hypothetical protein [Planctomycetota bacterium]
MPPGWAEQFAYEQAAAAGYQIDSNAVRADPVDSLVVNDADWAGTFDAGSPDGIDVGRLATSSRDTHLVGRRTPPPWRRPVPPKPAPRRGGDYTVMLLVFAAPLFLLFPVAWAWHLMHVLWPRRFDGRECPRAAEVR